MAEILLNDFFLLIIITTLNLSLFLFRYPRLIYFSRYFSLNFKVAYYIIYKRFILFDEIFKIFYIFIDAGVNGDDINYLINNDLNVFF
jgi:hypothetical protein